MSEYVNYNPDVLSCLANLSNDEVFTPPEIANAMLDMLPQELFEDPNAKFLDPACKTGVFLREIAKRLLKGLEKKIPSLQERIDHIFHEQLYAIAITELTALMSRRSVYCSKAPDSVYSVTPFENKEGNIRFRRTQHSWDSEMKDAKCIYCGASREQFDRGSELETHAYEFIHKEDIYKMKFDLIIGNPPYQLDDGGSKASAKPIYHLFVEQAKNLKPRYLTMIIPSRWFAGGKGLEDFRDKMLKDTSIRKIVDFFDPNDCFPGVDISGGVCYFLWSRDLQGECEIESHLNGNVTTMCRSLLETDRTTFIRFNQAVPIIRKVASCHEQSFDNLVSARKPYGLETNVSLHKYDSIHNIKTYAYPEDGFLSEKEIPQNWQTIDQYKVFISYAYGERGDFPYLVIGKPFIGAPNSCCTETYLCIGANSDRLVVKNIITYMCTKFFRFLVLLKKNTQHATKTVYDFVPMQDFSKPWTDEELYKKYNLTEEEISFIDSMIRPMDLNGED